MNEARSYKRKVVNYLIYPSFQWRIIATYIVVSLVAPLIIIIFQYFYLSELIAGERSIGLPTDHPYFTFLTNFQDQLKITFLGSILMSCILCFVVGMIFSHRMAGPIVKFRNYLNRVAQGEPEVEIHFRKDDFFLDLAEAYNKKFKK